MPRLCRWIAGLGLVLAATAACAWGHRGHQVIGGIADQLIAGTPAAAEVRRLLGGDLQQASVWADCARGVESSQGVWRYANAGSQAACAPFESAAGQAEMVDFVARNASRCEAAAAAAECRHRGYHYTDVSIAQPRYDPALPGARRDDLVQALGAAIAVLQGDASPAPFHIAGRTEALRLLVHYVGDLHQPLHVGAIYLGDAGQALEPASAQDAEEHGNAGGNRIVLNGTKLHAVWDDMPAALSSTLLGGAGAARAGSIAATAGPVAGWPAAWADDTLATARQAFRGLVIGPRSGDTWPAAADEPGYGRSREALQQVQLVKAGARLAQLLTTLWPGAPAPLNWQTRRSPAAAGTPP